MGVLGWLLIILGIPLLLGYAISDKKPKMWLRLGAILGVVGVLIVILGFIVPR